MSDNPNFTCDARHLSTALRRVTSIAGRAETIPILRNVLIESTGFGGIRLSATNLDMWLSDELAADVQGVVGVTADATLLTQIVSGIDSGAQVRVDVVDGAIRLTAGRGRYRVATLPAHDFPPIKDIPADATFTIAAADLRSMIARSRFAVLSNDVARPGLNGAHMRWREGALSIEAIDGTRAARITGPSPAGAEAMPSVTIPVRTLDLLAKALDRDETDVEVAVSAGRTIFSIGSHRIVSKMLTDTFPDISRQFPPPAPSAVSFHTAPLSRAIGRVLAVADGKIRVVRLAIAGDVMTVSARHAVHGESSEEIPVAYAGAPFEVGFNGVFLRENLDAMADSEAELHLADKADAPALIRPVARDDATYLLLPFRFGGSAQ